MSERESVADESVITPALNMEPPATCRPSEKDKNFINVHICALMVNGELPLQLRHKPCCKNVQQRAQVSCWLVFRSIGQRPDYFRKYSGYSCCPPIRGKATQVFNLAGGS